MQLHLSFYCVQKFVNLLKIYQNLNTEIYTVRNRTWAQTLVTQVQNISDVAMCLCMTEHSFVLICCAVHSLLDNGLKVLELIL